MIVLFIHIIVHPHVFSFPSVLYISCHLNEMLHDDLSMKFFSNRRIETIRFFVNYDQCY
jgi:hypothetical protein